MKGGKSAAAGPTAISSAFEQQQAQQPIMRHASPIEFTDPEAEQQFQQSFAVSCRFWDAAAAFATLVALLPFLELAFTTESQLCSATTNVPPTGFPRHLLKALWWCQSYWQPAITSYGITNLLEGAVAMLCCIAMTLWLLWTGGVSPPGAAYSKQRTLLMTAWRVGRSVTGVLVLVAYHLQQQAGWCAQTGKMPWGRNTVCAVTRLLWPAHFLSVSVSPGLAHCWILHFCLLITCYLATAWIQR
jgi:hypothetical protein